MIKPPFSRYHRATLERLVREGWERVEARAARKIEDNDCPRGEPPRSCTPIPPFEFQLLCAADAYLRSTK